MCVIERGEGFPLSLDVCVGMNGDREGGEVSGTPGIVVSNLSVAMSPNE
jgi:hypothetical protein